jgi:SAM-dependent methyltransferase
MFSIPFLDKLREAELEAALPQLKPGARLLEFGAGTGIQAKRLSERGFDVVAIDLASSGYADARLFPVIDYDGRNIPLETASIDVIFSSNVLEHVEDFSRIASEFRRITRPGGYGVHLMPSVGWRAWTLASGFPNAVVATASAIKQAIAPPPGRSRADAVAADIKTAAVGVLPLGHGTAHEAFSELYSFSANAWRRRFAENGFVVERVMPIGIFHTGHQLLGSTMSIASRKALSRFLGSAANLFVVRAAS